MGFDDFGKQVPTCGTGVEWVQDNIAAGWIIKLSGITAEGVGYDGSITACEGGIRRPTSVISPGRRVWGF